jgi:hypothetical protein
MPHFSIFFSTEIEPEVTTLTSFRSGGVYMKGLYLSSAITNPEDHLISIDIGFVHKYSCPETSCPRSLRASEWLVFHTLHWLFSRFHEAPPEHQGFLLKLLDEDTLNKWKLIIAALPPLWATHYFPFLTMLLAAHDTFSKVYNLGPLYRFITSSIFGCHRF